MFDRALELDIFFIFFRNSGNGSTRAIQVTDIRLGAFLFILAGDVTRQVSLSNEPPVVRSRTLLHLGNDDIGFDTFPLNTPPSRGVVLRRGQPESGSIGQGDNGLNRAFSESFLADDGGSF